MARLSTRKTTTRRSASPSSRRSFATLRRAAMLKRKAPAKRKAAKRTAKKKLSQVPNFDKRIKSFMSTLNTYAKKRTKTYGAKDPLAKVLRGFHKEFSSHLKKINTINPNFAKSLNRVRPSLSRIKSAPKFLKGHAPKLMKYLRENVRKNVTQFINSIQKTVSPIETEIRNVEKRIKNEIKKGKNKKIQYRVDPSIKKKMSAANTKIKNTKKSWGKLLTKLSLNGTREIKSAAKALKKQLDEIQRGLSRTTTLVNRYAKNQKKKAGYSIKKLFTPAQAKNCEKKWNKMKKELENSRNKVTHYFDQLKAIKLF